MRAIVLWMRNASLFLNRSIVCIKTLLNNKYAIICCQFLAIGFIVFLISRNYSALVTITNNLDLNFTFLILALAVLVFVVVFIGGLNWFLIINGLGVRIKFIESIKIQTVSNIPKYFPGTFWQYISKGMLSKKAGTPKKVVAIAILYELGITIWVGFWLLFLLIPSEGFFPGIKILSLPFWKVVGIIGVISSLSFPWIGSILVKKIKIPDVNIRNRYLIFVPFLVLSGWLLSIIGFWLSAQSLYTVGINSIKHFGFAYISGLIGGILVVPVPNGIGIREGIIVMALNNAFPEALSIILAGISRICLVLADVFGAIIGWLISRNQSNIP